MRVALSSQEALSAVSGIAPAFLGAGFLSGHVNLNRGEACPLDTRWVQRQGRDRRVGPAG